MRSSQWKLWQILIIATLLSQVSSYGSFLSWWSVLIVCHKAPMIVAEHCARGLCWIIGICCLLCDLEVNCCVLYPSNNANWGDKYQNSDPGQGSHWENCSGRKISERWVPWPRQPSGHNRGLLWIKVLQLEQLLCFWQTKYLVLSCRKLIIDGHEVKLGVWDTAGSERYDSITRMYYRYEVILSYYAIVLLLAHAI